MTKKNEVSPVVKVFGTASSVAPGLALFYTYVYTKTLHGKFRRHQSIIMDFNFFGGNLAEVWTSGDPKFRILKIFFAA